MKSNDDILKKLVIDPKYEAKGAPYIGRLTVKIIENNKLIEHEEDMTELWARFTSVTGELPPPLDTTLPQTTPKTQKTKIAAKQGNSSMIEELQKKQAPKAKTTTKKTEEQEIEESIKYLSPKKNKTNIKTAGEALETPKKKPKTITVSKETDL